MRTKSRPRLPQSAIALQHVVVVCVLVLMTGCQPTPKDDQNPAGTPNESVPAASTTPDAAPQAPAEVPVDAASEEQTQMPEAPWKVTFADGSANHFKFWQDASNHPASFAYSPMTPERSSSGTYSGGSPRTGELTAAQVDALWTQVLALEADTNQHAAGRMMGTGSFGVTSASGQRDFLVARGDTLEAFETFVAEFRGAP